MTKPRAILVYGKPGTTKTSFAGSTPGNKWWAEFDMGSFARAGYSEADTQFDLHKYYPPIAAMLDFGRLATDTKGQVLPHNDLTAGGYMDTAERFRVNLLQALELKLSGNADFSTIVLDTSNRLWDLLINARDEEVRNARLNDDRLGQLKFTETNRWMRGIIMSPKSVGVNLILVEHEEEPFGKPGVYQPKGFKEVENEMDAVLRFTVDGKVPFGELTKTATGGLDLKGMKIQEPTWDKVVGLLEAAEIIREAKMKVPAEYEMVLKLAGSL